MMVLNTRLALMLAISLGCLVACGARVALAEEADPTHQVETFDRDPGWIGFNNRIEPERATEVTQDFGFSQTNFAGQAPGEIGGQVWRSTTPAYYAEVIPMRTLDDRLSASGTFALTAASGGSGVFFGWFNHERQGWRPWSYLGWRLDGEEGIGRVFFDYTTQTWKAGGLKTGVTLPADGARHAWAITYDPTGNAGEGAITFTLDGSEFALSLAPGHKAEGATFDRFGLFNLQKGGGPMTVYFDDVVYDGKAEDFADAPGWEGVGNRNTFVDRELPGCQDFGFSPTHFAGAAPGEVGGTFWRTEPETPNSGYYADEVGPFTLDDKLVASGQVAFTRGSADSGMYLGWFDGDLYAPGSARPKGFLGVIVEGPSRIGHYFRVGYTTPDGGAGDAGTGPIIQPDERKHSWTLLYDPDANGGNGAIRATLDQEEVTLNLAAGDKAGGGTFDRFGLFSMRAGGAHVSIYFDDLAYTARREGAGG